MTNPEQNRDRWRNRRAMAWAAFVAALVYPLLLLVAIPESVVALAPAYYGFCTLVVGLYIGFATVDDRWQRQIDVAAGGQS